MTTERTWESYGMLDDNDPGAVEAGRSVFGLPVDSTLLVSDEKGTGTKSINKKRRELLEKARFLVRFLEPYEKIVFITTGCSPFGKRERRAHAGSFLLNVKRSLFVFTDRRILHILTTPKYEYRGSIAEIRYADCRRLYVEGTAFFAEYHTGRIEQFCCIPKRDVGAVGQIISAACEPSGPSDFPERNHLCPNCTHVLRPNTVTCPGCGLEFKDKAKALRYALLYPGGGYFYLRRWDTAIGHVFCECIFLLLAVTSLYVVSSGNPAFLAAFLVYVLMLAGLRRCAVYGAEHFVAEFIPVDLKSLLAEQDASPERKREPTIEEVLSVGGQGKGSCT
jgi:hypothetical protein